MTKKIEIQEDVIINRNFLLEKGDIISIVEKNKTKFKVGDKVQNIEILYTSEDDIEPWSDGKVVEVPNDEDDFVWVKFNNYKIVVGIRDTFEKLQFVGR